MVTSGHLPGSVTMPESRVDEVTRILSDRITTGHYPPGTRLPTYRELEAEFSVSEMVVRGAMRILKERGLTEAVHGVGNFVRGVSSPPADAE